MAKQSTERRWHFRPSLRPELALWLGGVWFENFFVVLQNFVTVRQTRNSAIFVEFLESVWDNVRGKHRKICYKIWIMHHENVSHHTSLA